MFSPERSLPIEQIKANDYTAMVLTKYGGHISFCEGLLPNGCNYTCRILTEYLKIVLSGLESENIDLNNNLRNTQNFNSNKNNQKSDIQPVFTLE